MTRGDAWETKRTGMEDKTEKEGKRKQPEDDEDLLTDEFAREMYREHILEHYKHPHNFGELKGATHACHEYNPLCGDDITVYAIIKDGTVAEVKFKGHGCAISMASASLVTDKIKGMSVEKAGRLAKEDALEMLAIPISQVRLKCALLPLEAIQKALNRPMHGKK